MILRAKIENCTFSIKVDRPGEDGSQMVEPYFRIGLIIVV